MIDLSSKYYKFNLTEQYLFKLDEDLDNEKALSKNLVVIYWLHQTTMILHNNKRTSPLPKILNFKDTNINQLI